MTTGRTTTYAARSRMITARRIGGSCRRGGTVTIARGCGPGNRRWRRLPHVFGLSFVSARNNPVHRHSYDARRKHTGELPGTLQPTGDQPAPSSQPVTAAAPFLPISAQPPTRSAPCAPRPRSAPPPEPRVPPPSTPAIPHQSPPRLRRGSLAHPPDKAWNTRHTIYFLTWRFNRFPPATSAPDSWT